MASGLLEPVILAAALERDGLRMARNQAQFLNPLCKETLKRWKPIFFTSISSHSDRHPPSVRPSYQERVHCHFSFSKKINSAFNFFA